MNDALFPPDPELDRLFAQARARRMDTSAAEYAFETRLLARLRADRDTTSVWAFVSWRLAPLFAACVVGLALWQAEMVSETNDTVAIATIVHPESVDLWNNMN